MRSMSVTHRTAAVAACLIAATLAPTQASAQSTAHVSASGRLSAAAAMPVTKADGEVVRVMTRNIFLGADLGPAFRSPGIADFIAANGEILRQVAATNMPVRSRGLAKEIHEAKPDIIGLQEGALWRTGPVNADAALNQQPVATTVYQDFVKLLLKRLNAHGKTYKLAYLTQEFDFEAPADVDGNPDTGPLFGADENGRLTMRDAILIRRGQGIQVKGQKGNSFSDANLYKVKVAGITEVQVLRGWQSIKVKVRNSPWFRFTNVHLEAFDSRELRPSIRARQAQELVDKTKTTSVPGVTVGDFNSDYPGLVPGDEQAYLVMKRNGYHSVGTRDPLSCCIEGSYNLKDGGSKKDFDHRVDQIFTPTPDRVKRLDAWVTGRNKHNDYWDSDHAGVVSELLITRRGAGARG